jgi:hypothetical protein
VKGFGMANYTKRDLRNAEARAANEHRQVNDSTPRCSCGNAAKCQVPAPWPDNSALVCIERIMSDEKWMHLRRWVRPGAEVQ